MGNDDLRNALMRAQGVQGFMGGGMATHAMPDGTVMPGATHADYEAMGMQEGGAPKRLRRETGAVINDAELRRQLEQMMGSETGAVINDAEKRNFIAALLRRESGAVIDDSEIAWADQTYFPQPGDTAEIIEQKRQAREQAAQQMGQDGTPQGAGFGQRMRSLMGGGLIGGGAGAAMKAAQEFMLRAETQPSLKNTPEYQAAQQMLRENMDAETGAATDPAQELQEAIQQLEIQKTQTSDPDEIKSLDRMIEVATVGANAPLREMALEMQAQGRGEDTALAHLRPGEVILPPEAFEDAQFESVVSRKFEQLGIDPEEAVAGVGIASLNPMTGLEEFGFLKKLTKGIKKLAKKIAPIAGPLANFIPGVGPILAGVIGAATNVVGGKGLSGAISGGLGGWGVGKALGGLGSLASGAGGTAAEFAKKGFVGKLSALGKGIGGLTGMFGGGGEQTEGQQGAQTYGMPDSYGYGIGDQNSQQGGGFKLSDIWSGTGRDKEGKFGYLGDLGAGLMGGGGGGGGGLGGLAAAGIPAYMLGKMAYDETKADKGVALTPLTTMGPTGRYNIEAEIARRTGTQAPNPVEFGLLPQGTFPQLSGGQPMPMTAAHGGAVYPMAYANGGGVAVEDFERMNGDINGSGTETSDDVPAMLSDGEFVMTGAAVRGAGGFDMKNKGGILTLTPAGTPDRERGTNVMHEMMDLFGSYAHGAV